MIIGGMAADDRGSFRSRFEEKYPLATKDDSWLYQFGRGTNDINQNVQRFSIGVPTIAVTVMAGGYAVITYGGQVIAVISTGWNMGLQRAYVWSTTYSSYYYSQISNYVNTIGIQTFSYARNFATKYSIDVLDFGNGLVDGLLPTPPDIGRNFWYYPGHTMSSTIKLILLGH